MNGVPVGSIVSILIFEVFAPTEVAGTEKAGPTSLKLIMPTAQPALNGE